MELKRIFRANYAQMIFVCAAFTLMVLIGCFSVGNVLQKEKLSTVTIALDETEKIIRAYLREPKIAFESIHTAVADMLDRDESNEAILAYLIQATNAMIAHDEGVLGFNAMYGYIRGEFIDTAGFKPDDDYIPQQRPWYQTAIRNEGAEYTAPYIDSDTGMMVISLAQEIHGANGDYYGVLSMDVGISWLMEYAETLQFAKGGYGMIVNQFAYVITHPQEQYRNIPLQDLGDSYAEISEMLRMNGEVSAVTIKDVDKTGAITFFKRLYNGWYVGVVMPAKSYYADLYLTAFILAALGICLMVALNLILLRLSAAKMRSEEENKSKTSFLARMSHEIRTPMNAIIGMAELALREDIPDNAYEHILAIKQSGANLLSIINDILDFSKIESGKLEIVNGDYLLASLINDVVNIIRTRAVDSHLRFVANIDSNIPGALIGDEIRIRQVLLNLLSNAVKYTEEGFVSLTITGEIIGENAVILTIQVADSGRGIKTEDMDKLFSDFVQIDLAKNKGIEGAGLGLAITQGFVKAMSGDITVSSEYGKGSTFSVTLPQSFSKYERVASVESPEEKSVLVYERREIYAKSVEYTVTSLNVECTIAATETEFYTEMAKGKYKFVFTSSALLEDVKNTVAKLGSSPKIVLLTEFGETISESRLIILTMPVHPVSVANSLNGVSCTSGKSKGDNLKFIAPSAKVLIVDDVDTNLKVAEGLMLPYKMQIDLCKSGRNAIEAVRRECYDLILMDHMMPEMDGVEATKRIRELDVDYCKRLPIIALTANAISGAREMFLQNGFNDFLSKPIEIPKLHTLLEKWIPKEKQNRYAEALPHDIDMSCESERSGPARHSAGKLVNITRNSYKQIETANTDSLEIRGVDTAKGIAMIGGKLDNYLEILAVFHKDGIQKINEIRLSLETDNLRLFAICVHGLKSVLASIGAEKLSEMAKMLEAAGNKEDLAFITEHNNNFLMELELLLVNIGEIIKSNKEEYPKQYIDPEIIKTELCQLKIAIEGFDSYAIDSAVECLQGYRLAQENGAAIESILQNVLIGEYDDAIALIDTLLGNL